MAGQSQTGFGLVRNDTGRNQVKNRKIYLEALLREAVRILKEQDPAVPAGVSAVPPSPVPPVPATNAAAATPPPPLPGDPNAPAGEVSKPFDVDQMIERLNVIRGGRSFADPEVYGQLVSYFKGLNDADKSAIDRFLQSIGKVVIQVDTNTMNIGGGAQPPMQQSPAPMTPTPGV